MTLLELLVTLTIVIVVATLAAVSVRPLSHGRSAGEARRTCIHQAVASRRDVALVLGDTIFLCHADGGLEIAAHARR